MAIYPFSNGTYEDIKFPLFPKKRQTFSRIGLGFTLGLGFIFSTPSYGETSELQNFFPCGMLPAIQLDKITFYEKEKKEIIKEIGARNEIKEPKRKRKKKS